MWLPDFGEFFNDGGKPGVFFRAFLLRSPQYTSNNQKTDLDFPLSSDAPFNPAAYLLFSHPDQLIEIL